jgi:hypothetical protein
MNEQPSNLNDLARGIGIRAAVLGVGALVVTGSLAALTLKAASSAVKLALGTTLLVAGAGLAAYEVKRLQKHLAGPQDEPSPGL